MFVVYFESHMGFMSLFQMPWRFAGCVPGSDDEIRRYRPNWKMSPASAGSFAPSNVFSRSSVGRTAFGEVPRSIETRRKSRWCAAAFAVLISSKDLRAAAAIAALVRASGSPLTSL